MNKTTGAVLALALMGAGFAAYSEQQAKQIETEFPPIGEFHTVSGVALHVWDSAAQRPSDAELPAVLFIHGASANLQDQQAIYADALDGKARTIFVDRPGHGYSQRGQGFIGPSPQAQLLGQLLDRLQIDSAVIVGHSYGGAVAVTMALEAPDKVAGLVDIAGPTHTWDTGLDWYHDWTAPAILGPVFTRVIALPFAHLSDVMPGALRNVFGPQDVPADYRQRTAPDLALRPKPFRANSQDLDVLLAHNERVQGRYGDISAPTSIIHGDTDKTVALSLHSEKLVAQIDGAELHVLPGIGHKPDWVARDVVLREIKRVAEAAGMELSAAN
ncbi:MAG: alpha/beta hydrolase [Pseudomonadota bacterium]